jgi:hypothetical protein
MMDFPRRYHHMSDRDVLILVTNRQEAWARNLEFNLRLQGSSQQPHLTTDSPLLSPFKDSER